jgi:hypothetical protein
MRFHVIRSGCPKREKNPVKKYLFIIPEKKLSGIGRP